MIKAFTVLEFELAIHHFKTSVTHSGCITQTVPHHSDNGSCCILDDLGDIRDSKGKGLFYSQPTAIGSSHGDIYRTRRFSFIIKTFSILKFKLVIHHLKTGIIHRVGVCITHILVGHTHLSDNGSIPMLCNRAGIQRQIIGSLVDIRDNKGEGLCLVTTCGSHVDHYLLLCLMVKTFIVHEFKLAILHLKTVIIHSVGRCIT